MFKSQICRELFAVLLVSNNGPRQIVSFVVIADMLIFVIASLTCSLTRSIVHTSSFKTRKCFLQGKWKMKWQFSCRLLPLPSSQLLLQAFWIFCCFSHFCWLGHRKMSSTTPYILCKLYVDPWYPNPSRELAYGQLYFSDETDFGYFAVFSFLSARTSKNVFYYTTFHIRSILWNLYNRYTSPSKESLRMVSFNTQVIKVKPTRMATATKLCTWD